MAAAYLLDEARAMDAEQAVARRAGRRWVRRQVETRLHEATRSTLPLRAEGVYLITGGLGAIGLTIGEWLARESSARLLLTSRSAMPSRDDWDAWVAEHESSDATVQRILAIRRIEAAGGQVRIGVADASDSDALARCIASAEAAWGPITGVVHAAGISDGAALANTTAQSLDVLLDAKVGGLHVLLERLGGRPLDFVALISSINAAVGNAGTVGYTAANAYFDSFVNSSRVPAGWRAVSIAFDAWSEIGMATKVEVPKAERDRRRAYVAAGITPREGVDAFARVLASGLPYALVSPFDFEGLMRRRRRRDAATAGTSTRASSRPTDSSSDAPTSSEGARYDLDGGVEARIAAVWRDLIGLDSIGLDDNFFELGGHSLLATRVLARVSDMFGVQVSLRTLFEAPTIREFAAIVSSLAQPVEVAGGDREEIEL
jgi:NAD(P)-dependent dehydrogenase (short-subunit alcohol dehydrogenase family)